MTDKKQLFPIKTNTACAWKWGYSSVYFSSGTTSSCTYAKKLKIPENNFSSFHNLPEKMDDRQQMLKGLWPKNNSCNYCKRIEDVGGFSERMSQLTRQNDMNVISPELFVDASAVEVTPTFLEVYFSNTCNMSCVYCGPHYSSKWEEELKLYGPMERFEKIDDQYGTQRSHENKFYDHQKEQFWKYLEENNRFKILRWFSLAGGEPLVIPELEECLDFWDDHPNENLTFQMNTNLKANDYRFDKFLCRIEKLTKQKKIYQFKVIGSLDGIGPQQEYARYGLDIKQWIRNFEKLLKTQNISVGINSAISALTLHEFPFLLEKIIEWNKDRRIIDRIVHSFSPDTSLTPVYIFNADVFKDTIDRCKKLFIVKNRADDSSKKRWEGFALSVNNSTNDIKKINELKKYLSELDKRRNTDWKKTFPWLVNL